MRKVFIWGLVFTFILAIPQFNNSAEAKDTWKTYNLIKDGELDTSKWSFNDPKDEDDVSIVSMSVDDGRVKFEHRPNTENQSVWLQLVKSPECVKGIQVEVTIGKTVDLGGNFRARIGSVAGAYESSRDYTWAQLAVLNRSSEDGGDRVYGALSALDYSNNYDLLFDPVYTQFYHQEEVDNSTYLIKMILDREKKTVSYTVKGFGVATYKMPGEVIPGYETFWGIGTRTGNADGKGTVWFSNNVRVLVDGECKPDETRPKVKTTVPKHKQENVDVAIALFKVKFDEAMNAWTNSCQDESCCPRLSYKDPNTGKYVLIDNACDFEYTPIKTFVLRDPEGPDLPPNSWFKVYVPKDFFRDLAGNGNAAFSLRFKTGNLPSE